MRSSQEFPQSVEGTVGFNRFETCALAQAFAKNKDTVEELKAIVGPEKLRILAAVLPTTESMTFVPSDDVKIAYGQIAKKEIERLTATPEIKPRCGHSVDEHKKALRLVIDKLQIVTN